jgi:hypothetical protein
LITVTPKEQETRLSFRVDPRSVAVWKTRHIEAEENYIISIYGR